MNKQRLIELLTEQAFDIYDYHRRNPEDGMGPSLETIINEAILCLLKDAETWGYNDMDGLKQALTDIKEIVEGNLRKG
jgi:hypothetical protein